MKRTIRVWLEAGIGSRALWRTLRRSAAAVHVRLREERDMTQANLRIARGSLVRPTLVVSTPAGWTTDDLEPACRLALTTAAWEGLDDWEWWQAATTSAPPFSVQLDALREAAPIILCEAGCAVDAESLADQHPELAGARLVHLEHSSSRRWPRRPSSSSIAAALGCATAVVATDGTLAWDAARAGIPRLPANAPTQGLDPRQWLPGTVAPALLDHEALWKRILETAASGSPLPPLCTPHWIDTARHRLHFARHEGSINPLQRTYRKWLKLVRDPDAFVRDAKLLRFFGRVD